jgi:hypothetical protein
LLTLQQHSALKRVPQRKKVTNEQPTQSLESLGEDAAMVNQIKPLQASQWQLTNEAW